jgi:Fe-coproporphyrin III synthase
MAIQLPLDTLGRDGLHLWSRWLTAALRNDARRWLRRGADPTPAFPAQFLIAVTYHCDSRCSHCNIWTDYLQQPEAAAQEMTPAEFERFLDCNPQLVQVVTTGGEPFNRGDIVEFWLAQDRRGQRTSCATNAIATEHILERENFLLSRLSGRHLRHFAVSLDGVEPVHDRVRGIPGNFARAWRLFQWAREQERRYPFYRAEISSTLTAANYREFPTLVEWLVKEGVPPDKIAFMGALPSAHYYRNETTLKPVTARDELAGILEELKRRHPGFGRNYFIECHLQWLRNPASGVLCKAGTAFGYIDPYWNVYPCLVLNRKLGNLREFDFDVGKLWRAPAARQFRAELAAKPCTLCFNECNRWQSMRATVGGLAAIAWRQAGRMLHASRDNQRRWRM